MKHFWWLAALTAIVATLGCTRVVEEPRPVRAWPVAPITAGQVSDVLSPRASREAESNLFSTVEPQRCAGLAREVNPPFLFDIGTVPAAHSAGQWNGANRFSIQEMAAVYPANFDAADAVDAVKRTLGDCRDELLTVVTMQDETLHFESIPAAEHASPQIALWSITSARRSCDNAFIAAHNAALEITACGDLNGYDVAGLADEALDRLNLLANMTS